MSVLHFSIRPVILCRNGIVTFSLCLWDTFLPIKHSFSMDYIIIIKKFYSVPSELLRLKQEELLGNLSDCVKFVFRYFENITVFS